MCVSAQDYKPLLRFPPTQVMCVHQMSNVHRLFHMKVQARQQI